ncbi:hypothetical protein D3C75_1085980 [compost metagenome]
MLHKFSGTLAATYSKKASPWDWLSGVYEELQLYPERFGNDYEQDEQNQNGACRRKSAAVPSNIFAHDYSSFLLEYI